MSHLLPQIFYPVNILYFSIILSYACRYLWEFELWRIFVDYVLRTQ